MKVPLWCLNATGIHSWCPLVMCILHPTVSFSKDSEAYDCRLNSHGGTNLLKILCAVSATLQRLVLEGNPVIVILLLPQVVDYWRVDQMLPRKMSNLHYPHFLMPPWLMRVKLLMLTLTLYGGDPFLFNSFVSLKGTFVSFSSAASDQCASSWLVCAHAWCLWWFHKSISFVLMIYPN